MVSKSVISSIFSMDFNSLVANFLTASDSPVKEDCTTYKSFSSIILRSAGIKSPADKIIISPIVISSKNTFFSFPSLNTVDFTATNFFNFSAALFDLNTSKNSSKVLTSISIITTIILA